MTVIKNLLEIDNFDAVFSLRFEKAPTLPQLKRNIHLISPLFLSFDFEAYPSKGALTGFQTNILRSFAEGISIEEQLEPILPQLRMYLASIENQE